MDVKHKTVVDEHFVGKYLIPTDNIRQQSEKIVKIYSEAMSDGIKIPPILIASNPPSRVGKTVAVSDIVSQGEAVYILDGHHRYIASLTPKASGYSLEAIFVDRLPDQQDIGTLYDYLDAYEWWAKKEI